MKASRTQVCFGFLILLLCSFSKPGFGQLKAQFISNVQSGCSPLIVVFQDQSQGNPVSWKWDLGNGAISSNQNPVTSYSDPGTYNVKLTVTNSAGQTATSDKYTITVYSNPTGSFNATPTLGCFPLSVNFNSNSVAGSGTIKDYVWDFGDGNISSDSKANHTYTSTGTFDITLKVTNSFGCTNAITKSDFIHIDNGVNAGFKISSIDVCKSPAIANFTNTSNGSGTLNYLWNYGDGSTGTSPTHSYAKSGTYNVVLTARSSGGCSDTATLGVTVAIPSSSFQNTDATCSNQQISFTNTSVPKPVSNTWYFSDGASSTQLNPFKTFLKPGTYTVKLVNVFSETCKDSIIKTITVASGPSPSFTANDTAKCAAPLLVNFKNTTTGSATKYSWDFGDGATSSDTNPAHTYTQTGAYTVTLTAINSNGCQNVFERTSYINIQPVTIRRILNLPDSGCGPLKIKPTVQLNLNSKIKTYSWDFSDGGTSTVAAPEHIYTKEGIFNVTVSIVTEDGCSDTYTLKNAVFVGHKPHANFTSDFDSVCANSGLFFYDASTNGPITFLQWNFGPLLDSAKGHSYYYTPTDTGYKQITLVAYNYGCADTFVKPRAVYAMPPYARFDVKLNCDNKTLVNFTDQSVVDLSHTWDFGDGKTSTDPKPAHTYLAPGVYTVNLYTVNKTCRDTATSIIHVIDEKGDISLEKNIYCRGNTMSADIAGVNESNIKSTTWDFGDGAVKTVNGATQLNHIYTATGKFLVTALMTDLNNCEYNYKNKDSITVYGPLSKFGSAKPGICQGNSVTFNDQSLTDGIHNIVKWTWDYGDDVDHNFSSSTTFSNTYKDTGYYYVKLTVTDSYGCADSQRKTNYVYVTHPYARFQMSDSISCKGGLISFQDKSIGSGLTYNWNFGEGSTSNRKNTFFNYPKDSTFFPSLNITDVNGCTADTTEKLIVSSPFAQFSMSDSVSSCPPLEVNFENKSTFYASYTWDFGDGSTSVLQTPSHLYNFPGKYPVKLSVKGHGTCSDSLIRNITIKGPTGKIKYDAAPLCAPGKIAFSAEATNTINYFWDFRDGNTTLTNGNQTSHVYDTGYFVPKLILTDESGCKVSIPGKDTVKIYSVKANAYILNTSGCDSTLVEFSDTSSSNDKIIHRLWYFGDNDSADAKNVSHKYAGVGNYNIKLIEITKTGCTDTLNINTPVTVSPSPKINIEGDTAACAKTPVSFAANNTTADGSPINWSWNFNNGISDSAQKVSTSYNSGGIYVVSLKGSYKSGCSDSTTIKIKINNAPVVKAMPDSSICKNSNFKLNVTGAQKYVWQGIGLSCTNCQYPAATTATDTKYIVTGTDEIGCKASDSTSIHVIAPQPMNVTGSDTICVGESVQLSASGVEKYQWYPPTYLNNDKSAQPTSKPARDTTIQYKVIGFGEQNCFSDTAFVTVKAFAVPHISFQSDELVIGSGETVRLISNSSADITQWRWSPSAGLDNPGSANPIASPRQTTTYSVVASNGGGCVSRDEITIRVVCKNTNVYVPNTFSPNNDGMNDVFYPRGTGLFNIKSFRVFNRWGQIMFEKFNVAPNIQSGGWNGMYNGKSLASDVYVYMMEIVCENGNVIPIKGNITLLK